MPGFHRDLDLINPGCCLSIRFFKNLSVELLRDMVYSRTGQRKYMTKREHIRKCLRKDGARNATRILDWILEWKKDISGKISKNQIKLGVMYQC